MARLLRGEIRRVTIEPTSEVIGHEQGNSRPALILSNDHFNDATELVIVALITSSPPRNGNLYSLPIQSVNMPKPSWILTGQIRTLAAARIGDLIGTVDADELARVHRAMLRLFEIP